MRDLSSSPVNHSGGGFDGDRRDSFCCLLLFSLMNLEGEKI